VGAAILKLDSDRKLLNADITVQKHVNKCEQRIIPELNGIIFFLNSVVNDIQPYKFEQEEDDLKWLRY